MVQTGIGQLGALPLECINPRKNKWRIRWDITDRGDGTASWKEQDFDHKPSEYEIRVAITSWVDESTRAKILSGFTWNGMQVWLSIENQMNYKAIYDLAIQGNEGILPITFKFGTDESPVFYTFNAVDELSDFHTKAIKHIHDCLSEGWASKEGIDKLFS